VRLEENHETTREWGPGVRWSCIRKLFVKHTFYLWGGIVNKLWKRGLRWSGLALMLCGVVGLMGCGGGDENSGGTTNGGSSGVKEIKILVAAPLSGDYAETGKDMAQGAELAAAYINEQGGIKSGPNKGAKVVIERVDDEMSTSAATTIASRYLDDDSYYAFLGFITSGQAQAAATVLERADLSLIAGFASADFLTSEADNIVVISPSIGNFARVAANFAVDEFGVKTVGTIAGDFSFLDSYYKGLTGVFTEKSVNYASKQTYPAGTSDFSALLTNIAAKNPDIVMCGAFQADAGRIAAQMRKMDMNMPMVDFIGDGWGETFGKTAGSSLQIGEFYEMTPADRFPEPGSLGAEMSKRYLEKYGKSINAPALHFFDGVLTIAAIAEMGSKGREDLLSYATKVTGEGLLGPIAFTADLKPKERWGTMSKVTGNGADDRELAARYVMYGETETVERVGE